MAILLNKTELIEQPHQIQVTDELTTTAAHGVVVRTDNIYDFNLTAKQIDINKYFIQSIESLYNMVGISKFNDIANTFSELIDKYPNQHIPIGQYFMYNECLYVITKDFDPTHKDAEFIITNGYCENVKIGQVLFDLRHDLSIQISKITGIEIKVDKIQDDMNGFVKFDKTIPNI